MNSRGMAGALHLSLHDVAPFHSGRIRRAEGLFRDLGITKVTYLLVPEFHGGKASSADPAFIDWCRGPRPFEVEWHLHGYRHLEAPSPSGSGGKDFLKRKFMTAGEGEFLALGREAQASLVGAGMDCFRQCLGYDPEGFVAPAWLFNPALFTVLREAGIRYTEDHGHIYRIAPEGVRTAPVITWATRTRLRKYGSLVVCPLLAGIWRRKPLLRIATHPFDFDHPSTVENIRQVIRNSMRQRLQVFSSDLDFPTPGPAGSG